MECLTQILSALASIAVIVASGVAFYSVKQWRAEAVGRRRIELAEEILAAFYEARIVMASIRNPTINFNESKDREPALGESENDKCILDMQYAFGRRYDKHIEFREKVSALRFRAAIYFDKNKEKLFIHLFDVFLELKNAIMSLNKIEGLKHTDVKTNFPILFAEYGAGDEMATKLNKIIKDAEEKFNPIIGIKE